MITILSFFQLLLRRQCNYVFTSQKRATDLVENFAQFCQAPAVENEETCRSDLSVKRVSDN